MQIWKNFSARELTICSTSLVKPVLANVFTLCVFDFSILTDVTYSCVPNNRGVTIILFAKKDRPTRSY